MSTGIWLKSKSPNSEPVHLTTQATHAVPAKAGRQCGLSIRTVKTLPATGEFFDSERYDDRRTSIQESCMKRFFKFIGILAGLAVLAILIVIALMPWMDRWGATENEIGASLPGDELVPAPRVVYNRVVTVQAT